MFVGINLSFPNCPSELYPNPHALPSDFSYETINEEIAKVNAKGTITGQKVGTTWVKAL